MLDGFVDTHLETGELAWVEIPKYTCQKQVFVDGSIQHDTITAYGETYYFVGKRTIRCKPMLIYSTLPPELTKQYNLDYTGMLFFRVVYTKSGRGLELAKSPWSGSTLFLLQDKEESVKVFSKELLTGEYVRCNKTSRYYVQEQEVTWVSMESSTIYPEEV